ncbi:hypothetical protein NU219Hw_g1684t1 [Hortaea werneckii]
MNCRGEVPSTLPKDCSGPYSGTGYVGDFVDACGTDYAVHCGMRIDSDPFAVYEDVPELSKCMEACDRFPNCTSATHLGSRCLLDANTSMKAVHGHPELAALIKGSYRGMRMQTAPPSMVREYRRQASRTTVNPAAATVPVCPNSNGQLYEDDYGALYIISCGAYNTGTNYTILWSRDSGCTTLRCCMDYCDGFPDCFGTALLLGTNNNNCTFFYPPNGTHYANTAYNIAYQYRAANQPVYITTRTTTTTTTTRTSSSLTSTQTVTYTTVSYATATQTSYLTQTTTSVGTLTSTAVSSYYTRVVNTVTTSYVQTTTQNLPANHANLDRTNHGNIDAPGVDKYVDNYGKDHTNLHAPSVDEYFNNDGKDHTNIYCSNYSHIYTCGVDEYFDDYRTVHTNIHAPGVDEYFDNYGKDHTNLHCANHNYIDASGVDEHIDDYGKDHTNLHCAKYNYLDASGVDEHIDDD